MDLEPACNPTVEAYDRPRLVRPTLQAAGSLSEHPPQSARLLCLCDAVPPLCRYNPGPWKHMFGAQLQLSQLTELGAANSIPWQAADLDRLVSSCSALQKLSLLVSDDLKLTALLQLTQLTSLCVRGVTSDTTAASLSRLQGLQELELRTPCRLNDGTLAALTVLNQLTQLVLPYGGLSTIMVQELKRFQQERHNLCWDFWITITNMVSSSYSVPVYWCESRSITLLRLS